MTSPSLADGRIGPCFAFVPIRIVSTPLVWPALAAVLFAYIPPLRIALWSAFSGDPSAQSAVLAFHDLQRTVHMGPLSLAILGAIVLRALIWYSTSSYRITGDFLHVNNGVMGRLKGGFLQSYTNTIARSLIIDCDITRGPLELLGGCGTLWIKGADNTVARMDCVSRPTAVRDALLTRSALANVRTIATV